MCDYLTESFTKLRSPNRFKIEIDNASDWWLGDLDGPWFKALENAVSEEWGVEPLRIREGGVSLLYNSINGMSLTSITTSQYLLYHSSRKNLAAELYIYHSDRVL